METKNKLLPHILSIGIILSIDLLFILLSPQAVHWFLIPITLCGFLITPYAIRWFLGNYDLFDPRGVLGILGFYHFYLSPLLWVLLDAEMLHVTNPSDWRVWFGVMGLVNIAGLIAYKIGLLLTRKKKHKRMSFYKLDKKMFFRLSFFIIVIALSVFITFLIMHGGISGIISNLLRIDALSAKSPQGWGLFFVFMPVIPLMIFYLLIVNLTSKKDVSNIKLFLIFILFIALVFFLSPRVYLGSRNALVYPLFIALAATHLNIKKISKKYIILGMVFLVFILFLFSFYKAFGSTLFEMTDHLSTSQIMDVGETYGKTIQTLILSDLTRADIQAFLAYRLVNSGDYHLQFGKTYFQQLPYMVIPRQLWPEKPEHHLKSKATTDLMHGAGSYDRGIDANKLLGIAGEAMLNFHFFGVPLVYLILGLLVGCFSKYSNSLRINDSRRFIAPIFTLILIINIFVDMDNILNFFILYGFLWLILVVLLSSKKVCTE